MWGEEGDTIGEDGQTERQPRRSGGGKRGRGRVGGHRAGEGKWKILPVSADRPASFKGREGGRDVRLFPEKK